MAGGMPGGHFGEAFHAMLTRAPRAEGSSDRPAQLGLPPQLFFGSASIRVHYVSLLLASRPYEVALRFRDGLPDLGPHDGADAHVALCRLRRSGCFLGIRERRVRYRTRQSWSALSLLRLPTAPSGLVVDVDLLAPDVLLHDFGVLDHVL